MAEAARARPWAGRAIYAALIAVLIFAMLLPLDTVPPDLSATELLVPAPGAGPGDGTRMVDLQAIEPRRWVMPPSSRAAWGRRKCANTIPSLTCWSIRACGCA